MPQFDSGAAAQIGRFSEGLLLRLLHTVEESGDVAAVRRSRQRPADRPRRTRDRTTSYCPPPSTVRYAGCITLPDAAQAALLEALDRCGLRESSVLHQEQIAVSGAPENTVFSPNVMGVPAEKLATRVRLAVRANV
jgi:hypothetical protein